MTVLRTPALEALRALRAPTGQNLPESGLIDALTVDDGAALLTLRATAATRDAMERLAGEAEQTLLGVAGIARARVVLTAHREAPPAPGGVPHGGRRRIALPEVRHIVAVASGKGGVGKSTTAVNLAVSLVRQGLRVGLLDADIYGPSLPTMLGEQARPEVRGDRIQPVVAWGLKTMSMGYLVDRDSAMIWRGPMVMGAIQQLLGQVDWGALDMMVVDMPPGTGDAQLTLTQSVTLAGAVLVSTPQDVALADVRRGAAMFAKTDVRLLGLVENMSFFCCPACGTRTDIFGHGGARLEAGRLRIPFLGAVPLLASVRDASDAGTPIAQADPESAASVAYAEIAQRVVAALGG